jgi:hypothetical protein
MKSAIFSTATESYQVSQIAYAGPVTEIPQERRKGDSTHSFRLVTSAGAARCYFRSPESARKARGALTAMMSDLKPNAFKHGNELIDPRMIVSFGTVVELKLRDGEEMTHAFPVTVATREERGTRLWLRYRSEDNARKGRKAMYAILHAANGLASPVEEPAEGEAVKEEASEQKN